MHKSIPPLFVGMKNADIQQYSIKHLGEHWLYYKNKYIMAIRYLILIQVSNTYQNELRMYINNVTFQDLKLI